MLSTKKLQSGIALILCFLSLQANATDYYLSYSKGNDTNKGTIKAPWKSIQKLNTVALKPGDRVLFAKGEKFIGQINLAYSGTATKPIIYTSYGEGTSKPIITGAKPIEQWTKNNNGQWEAPFADTTVSLYINNQLMNIARHPNKGFLKIDEGSKKQIIMDAAIEKPSNYWAGATAHIRTSDWTYESRLVASSENKTFSLAAPTEYDLGRGWGYFLDNKLSLLDTANEWYQDIAKKKIYFQGAIPIAAEADSYDVAFQLIKNASYIQISDLKIEKYRKSALVGNQKNVNIELSGVEIAYTALSAIILSDGPVNFKVLNSSLHDISGSGIKLHMSTAALIENNTFRTLGLREGYGDGFVNNGIAIIIDRLEKNVVRYNVIDSIGSSGIRIDGNDNLAEFNIIKNALQKYQDMGAMYSWVADTKFSYNSAYRNNIIYQLGKGGNDATPHPDHTILNGIYLDNKVNHFTLENNIIIGITNSGILCNSNTFNNKIIGNTIFDCSNGLEFTEFFIKGTETYDNESYNNTVISLKENQVYVRISDFVDTAIAPGKFDNNTYCNAWNWWVASEDLKFDQYKQTKNYSFEEWQRKFGYDKHSKSIAPRDPWAKFPEIFFNTERQPKTVHLGNKKYKDLNNTAVEGSFELQPFTSRVLFLQKED